MNASESPQSSAGLWLIIIFKYLQTMLFLALGFEMFRLLHEDIAATLMYWIRALHVDPDNRYIHGLFVQVMGVDHQMLVEMSVGSFFYAALMLTEGIGLMLGARWVSYLVVIETSGFIPIELYEPLEQASLTRVIVLSINVAIVWYLVKRLMEDRSGPRQMSLAQ